MQLHFTTDADSMLKLSDTATYYVYNLVKLLTMGFRQNRNCGANVFTYCGFCKSYRWHVWFSRRSYLTQDIAVCDTCQNYLSDEKMRAF